ncbi:MAG: autotransporter outer membrane beta-barrel domain-containing protein [Verrucomicrobiaceae bacterium]|nr:autotransporter outer membrane beta-barrel domain-containing protein [Verrucomicrobiaceae bacterium]
MNNGSTLTIINTNGNALANNISSTAGTGTVNVNSLNNNTLSGVISNAISLQQNGTGRTTLTGLNAYTGTTTITAGTLNVLGSHIGGANYSIAANSVLSGAGNIRLANNQSVNNLGTISVGNANIAGILPLVGQVLTIGTSGTGAINMGLGSVLAVDILSGVGQGFNGGPGNGTSDNLNLIGTLDATNGGTLVIGNPNSLVGFTGGDAWLLINNDSDANGVNEGVIVGTLGLNDAALGLTATQVGNFNQTSGIYTVIETVTGLQMANIQGQSVMAAAQGMLSDVNGRLFFLRAGYGERGYDGSLQASMDFGVEYGEGDSGKSSKSVTPVVASDSPEWQTFINANYTDVKISAIGAQQAGFESDTWTAGFGLERAIGNNFTLGFAANWLESRQHYTNNVGKLEMSGISLSAYGSYVRKSFWADLLYSFGSFDIDTARDPIGFPIAQGKTDAQTHALQFNTGWNLRFQDNTLVTGPFAGVDYMHATVDGYSETSGGLAALRYNSRNYDSLITRVGWSVSKKVNTDFAKITAQLRLAYERQNMDYNDATSVSLINQPFTSTSNQQNIGQDYMSAGAGVNFQFTPNLGLLLNYQGQFFRDSVQAHYFGLRMGYSF